MLPDLLNKHTGIIPLCPQGAFLETFGQLNRIRER
jgi:hypothetical protein